MARNKIAAAYLAYSPISTIPAGAANGSWKLVWGPAINDGTLAYVAQGADGSYGLAFRGTDTDTSITGSSENIRDDLEGFNFVPWRYPQGQTPPLEISAGTN